MKTFWNNHEGFSIKDLLGILLGTLFIGMSIFAVCTSDPARVVTSLEVVKTISPILLTIVGGYAVTEGTRGVMDTYYQSQNRNNGVQQYGDSEMKPPAIGGGEI